MTQLANLVLSSVRRVQLNWDETLQEFAARVLGDAAQWALVAQINNLAPPYVTGDPALANDRVALYGDTIVVPAVGGDAQVDAVSDSEVLLVDVALPGGNLDSLDGDFDIVSGRANLSQALRHRIETEEGDLLFHPTYGCLVGTLRGQRNDSINDLLAAGYVKRAIASDVRVDSITSVEAQVDGDALRVNAHIITISGKPMPVSVGG